MSVKLSVNVNKVATLRNSRGGVSPSVVEAVRTCVAAGAPGITVHPRQDERHIRAADVREIAELLASIRRLSGEAVEFNIEGDPRPDLLELVLAVRPTQCTLVPVTPGEITSHAGWRPDTSVEWMRDIVSRLQGAGVRVSLFVDPDEPAIDWAAATRAERVELYTEPYARAFAAGDGPSSFESYRVAAVHAHAAGLAINAGHDLDLANLTLFRTLPHLAEVSIGHALISHALWVGLDRAVRDYLAAVAL
jgi:pyridoxine 5-phosphate synthase